MLQCLRGRGRAVLVLALVAGVLAPTATAQIARTSVIVQVDGDQSPARAAVAQAGGSVTAELPIVSGFAAEVPARAVDDLTAAAGVRAVTPNEPVSVAETPTPLEDPDAQFVAPQAIGADKVWAKGYRGAGVNVALIDTGVSPVRDLAGRVVRVSDESVCVNFSGEATCDDTYGHGTFVAGLIAGTGASSNGRFMGIAPDAGIVSIKIAGRDGSADVSKVLAAIQWVVSFADAYGIKVLNLSLGTDSTTSYRFDPLNFAVERAWRSGITVVVAASNRGPAEGTISKPADDPLVISVGAVDDVGTTDITDDLLPSFSARGPTVADGLAKPDVVAPGAHVISSRAPGSFIESQAGTSATDPYRRGSGTSMAAGIVSGAAALLYDVDGGLRPDRVKFTLMSTARAVASSDRLAIGTGLIDVDAAAFAAPPGLANTAVTAHSDGSGSLDGSRGRVIVSGRNGAIRGDKTAEDTTWDPTEYRSSSWDRSSWRSSQWLRGSAGWSGGSWYGGSWYGGSWYGGSWYATTYSDLDYGIAILGSSWYGAWD